MAARPRPPRLSRLSRRGAAALLAALALLAGCVAPDAHVPDFARIPYEPFGREAAIAIALREWRLWGAPTAALASDEEAAPRAPDAKPERAAGLWQRVGEYWWLGLDADRPERAWTGKHDARGQEFPPQRDGRFAWSAAFVSYVMRIAGAGARFPYSETHSTYINAAWHAAHDGGKRWALRAEPPDDYAPQAGDLICAGRADARGLRFADLPAGAFPAHCDIVVAREPAALAVIGGNIDDAVTLRQVPIAPDGMLVAPAAPGASWLTVIRVLYDR